ncbi:hypothetical protein SNEBB_002502 [Seison nebaliae]|nr:hypothetical protein SNEBB_002502 [Seison nebaliae]
MINQQRALQQQLTESMKQLHAQKQITEIMLNEQNQLFRQGNPVVNQSPLPQQLHNIPMPQQQPNILMPQQQPNIPLQQQQQSNIPMQPQHAPISGQMPIPQRNGISQIPQPVGAQQPSMMANQQQRQNHPFMPQSENRPYQFPMGAPNNQNMNPNNNLVSTTQPMHIQGNHNNQVPQTNNQGNKGKGFFSRFTKRKPTNRPTPIKPPRRRFRFG